MKPLQLNEAQSNPVNLFKEYYERLGINVEYEKFENGFGKFRLTLKEPIGDRIETTPILLLPGIANPIDGGGEFGGQIQGQLNNGAKYIDYIHYPYDRPLDIDEAVKTIEKSITSPTKLASTSLGSDIILEYLYRGNYRDSDIDDVLLVSPYLISRGESYGSLTKEAAYRIAENFPALISFLWPFVSDVRNSNTTPINFSRSNLIREQFKIRKEKVPTQKSSIKIRVMWSEAKGEMGEFADLKMRETIENMCRELTMNVNTAKPYQMNHGEQSIVDNHFLFGARMTEWYMRNKLGNIDA